MEYSRKIQSREKLNSASIDDMIEFLLPYITEPEDRNEAREMMLNDLTEDQFNEMFEALTPKDKEGEENPTVEETPLAKSEQPQKAE